MKWVAAWIGYPEVVVLDQSPQFQSAEFRSLLTAAGIRRKGAGIESLNTLREAEHYHAYLRNNFEKVHCEHPMLNEEIILKCFDKSK